MGGRVGHYTGGPRGGNVAGCGGDNKYAWAWCRSMHEPVRGGGGGGSSGLTGQRNTAQRVDGGAMRGVASAEDTSAHISIQLRDGGFG